MLAERDTVERLIVLKEVTTKIAHPGDRFVLLVAGASLSTASISYRPAYVPAVKWSAPRLVCFLSLAVLLITPINCGTMPPDLGN